MKKMFKGKFDLDLFGDELSDTKAKALVRLSFFQLLKTDEEINKLLINESFSQLQKALHILKKGYEVQKKSVKTINNILGY